MVEYIKREAINRYGEELQINWEKTYEIEKQEKYVRFNKWCDENGVLHESCRYPVAFGDDGQLIGIAATREIGLREAFIYVPQRLMINESKFKADPQIGHLIEKHPDLFKKKINSEHIVLMFFVMHEFSKGTDSFWYEYFQTAALPDLLACWEQSELDELHDPILRQESIDEMEEMVDEFDEFMEVVRTNSDCLKVESFTFENYLQAHYHVSTRCFGYAIPELSLVPFADNANHHTTDNLYEVFNFRIATKLEKDKGALTEKEKCYETKDRSKIDFMKHLPAGMKESAGLPVERPERPINAQSARYARKVERRHGVVKISPNHMLEHPELQDKDIWELGYISTSDSDDNDEDESEEDDDEDGESEQEDASGESSGEESKQEKPVTKQTTTEPPSVQAQASQSAATSQPAAAASTTASEAAQPTDKPDNDQVPDFAKRLIRNGLLQGKKREPQIRYVYTHIPGDPNGPQKTAIIKKAVQRAPPKDLIQLLIEKKHQMYDKELKMQAIKEHDDASLNKSEAAYLSSDEEEQYEENFLWYSDPDPNTYFVLSTLQKNMIEKDQQVYVCYGRRSNRYLLSGYGFLLAKNKYNALSFRVWLDFRPKDLQGTQPSVEEEDAEDNRISKILKLKKDRLKEDLLAYIRMSLVQKNEQETGKKVKENILISTPVDVEFEMLTLGCAVHLLESLLTNRFRGIPVEADKAELAKRDLPWRKRLALQHRVACKEIQEAKQKQGAILNSNIRLCNVLMYILANLTVALDGGKTEFTKDEVKRIYMQKIAKYEDTEEEVMLNRLRFRKYIRELILNQPLNAYHTRKANQS